MSDLYPDSVWDLLDHLKSAQLQRSRANMRWYVDRAVEDVEALKQELFDEAVSTRLVAVRLSSAVRWRQSGCAVW